MIIYVCTNIVNGKEYVGLTIQTLQERKTEHLFQTKYGCKSYFHRAIRKYGESNFVWAILEDNIDSFELLKDREKFWIKTKNTFAPKGYNLTLGGQGSLGRKMSEEAKAKIGNSSRGRIDSAETRMKKGAYMRGRKHSAEIIEKIRKSNLGRKRTEETRKRISVSHMGLPNPRKGCHLSDETKLKLRNANLGKKYSEEVRRKVSEAGKGRRQSEETKRKRSESNKLYYARQALAKQKEV